MKTIRLAMASVALLQLTACGGGGGSGVGSTPTPAPTPTPSSANIDLLGPSLQSEIFTNDAATGSANYPKSGATPTISASQTSSTITYEAATQKYTITTGNRSQSFLPSNIDNTQSSSGITVYIKKNGNTTDSLTLTKPGTSGRFNYKYVAGGFWQRTVDGSSTISGNFDAISYGVETPNAGVPRTGYAAYGVDLLGARTFSDNVFGLTGQGNLLVDFAAGQITTRGQIDNSGVVGITDFAGSAQLSSADGTFAGNIDFSGITGFSGSLNGRFYGPTAEEVGAAFSAKASDNNVIVGALIGRQSAVPGGNTTVTNLTSAEFLKGDSARLTFDGAQGGLSLSVQNHSTSSIVAYYDPLQGRYNLFLGDRSGFLTNTDIAMTGLGNMYYGGVSPFGHYVSFDPRFGAPSSLQYLRAGRSYTVNGLHYRFDDIIFGIATLENAVPRTGQGGYAINLAGSIAQVGANDLQTISGFGDLIADFSNNSLSTQGTLFNYFNNSVPTTVGTFSGAAAINASANSFSGSLIFSGSGNYSGSLKGRFYGPAADEVGAIFSLDGANGSAATGTLYGARDASVVVARTPLTQLTTPTDLYGMALHSFTGGGGQTLNDPNIKVSYDPTSGTYAFISQAAGWNFSASPPLNHTITAADRVPGSSDASYTAYHTNDVDGRLLNPGAGNPTISLSYTSLADLTSSTNQNGIVTSTEYFVPFGTRTPLSQMPRSGMGSYTGIIIGHGSQAGFSSDAVLNGTSAMNIDFGSGSGSASLAITATDRVSGTQMAIGTFSFSGGTGAGIMPAGNNNFTFNLNGYSNLPLGGGLSGNLAGSFFGANAAEFGGIFALHVSDGSGQSVNDSHFEGATVGKR